MIKGLADGSVDIVIGTHRLCSRRSSTRTSGWSSLTKISGSGGTQIGHHAALRQFANRLGGILPGCLRTGTKFDENIAWQTKRCRGLTRNDMGCRSRLTALHAPRGLTDVSRKPGG